MDKKKVLLIGGIIAIVIIGLLLLYTLFFAGGGDDPDDPGGPPSPTSSVTLEYWGLWEPESVMQPLIEKYESANPNVTIVYTQRSFNQYEETLYTRLEQGSSGDTPAPDIFRVNNTWLNKFQPYLSPLPSSIMDSSTYSSTFYPTAVSDFTGTDANIYAIPLEIDGLALFYNKEIFERAGLNEPPTSWDDLIDVAQQLTVRDASGNIEQAGLSMGSSNNVRHSADILSLLMLQNGVEINQNFNTEVSLTSQSAIDAMDFYTSFVTEYEVWDPDMRTDLELFFQGKLAMMFAPSWRAFDIINSNPSIEFGIAVTPNLPNQTIFYSMYWGEAVSNTSEYSTEAWKFVKFLSEEQQMKDFYNNSIQNAGRAFGEPYSRRDIGVELKDDPYANAFITMAPDMKAWKMGEQSFIEEQLNDAINDVAVNGEDSEDALENAEEAINEKLSQSIQ